MRQALAILILIGMTTLGVKPTQAQIDQNLRAWWAGGEIGEGQLSLSSDQIHRDRTPTFALGFFGGHRLGDQARVGLEMNGWLLQASNLNDPTVGESVSNVLGVIDDIRNSITVETGRHYSVVEFKVAAIWHFGKRAGE
jgi:hypothetical protein